jgi:predicted transcriptional regulator
MKVLDRMRSELPLCRWSDDLSVVAERMKAAGSEALPVVDDRGVVMGLITHAQIKRQLKLNGAPASTILVPEVADWTVPVFQRHDDCAEALQILITDERNYAVVTDEQRHFLGLLRLKDLTAA